MHPLVGRPRCVAVNAPERPLGLVVHGVAVGLRRLGLSLLERRHVSRVVVVVVHRAEEHGDQKVLIDGRRLTLTGADVLVELLRCDGVAADHHAAEWVTRSVVENANIEPVTTVIRIPFNHVKFAGQGVQKLDFLRGRQEGVSVTYLSEHL